MIELIHCHILKTGGVSFLKMIEEIYGKEAIAFPWTWIGMVPEQGKGFNMLWNKWPELIKLWTEVIPVKAAKHPKLRVLQGHHPVGLYKSIFPQAKRIAWVRHPIARVVSNWNHDMKNKHQPKMELMNYANQPHNRNIMSFYVGHNIDNMDWIGVLECMERDIKDLALLLDWPHVPEVPHLNRSTQSNSFQGIGEEIAKLNMQDMEIYAEVLSRKPGEQYYG